MEGLRPLCCGRGRAAAAALQQPRLCPKSSGGLIKEVSLEKWGWKTIVSQFNCGGKKSLVGSVLANFLDHAHNYDVVDEFTATSFPGTYIRTLCTRSIVL